MSQDRIETLPGEFHLPTTGNQDRNEFGSGRCWSLEPGIPGDDPGCDGVEISPGPGELAHPGLGTEVRQHLVEGARRGSIEGVDVQDGAKVLDRVDGTSTASQGTAEGGPGLGKVGAGKSRFVVVRQLSGQVGKQCVQPPAEDRSFRLNFRNPVTGIQGGGPLPLGPKTGETRAGGWEIKPPGFRGWFGSRQQAQTAASMRGCRAPVPRGDPRFREEKSQDRVLRIRRTRPSQERNSGGTRCQDPE